MRIELPYKFTPREYQKNFCRATLAKKFIMSVFHRRAGKDYCHISMLVPKMMERVGLYFYIFPTATQGRKILWDGIDGHGTKFLSHIPECLIAKKNNQEMKMELINGSILQIIGSDNYNDTIIGTNPVGLVLSEYALQKPEVWSYTEPILVENKGFAWFNFTPRGRNFAYNLWKNVATNPKWHVEKLTVEDTGVISPEEIAELRKRGTPESIIQQEYFCSYNSFTEQYIYSGEMELMLSQKRIDTFDYDPSYPLYTAWDLGVSDSMAIIFFQVKGSRIIVVDYYENSGRALQWYNTQILNSWKEEKNYHYQEHFAPHDISNRDLMTTDENGFAMTRIEGAEKFGLKFTRIPRVSNIWDRINDAKEVFPRVYINTSLTRLIDCLSSYQKRKNERLSSPTSFEYDPIPLHDWASHASDAFGTMCQAVKQGFCSQDFGHSYVYEIPQSNIYNPLG